MSEPKIRGYRKRMLNLWQRKGMFCVSEQRLVEKKLIGSVQAHNKIYVSRRTYICKLQFIYNQNKFFKEFFNPLHPNFPFL